MLIKLTKADLADAVNQHLLDEYGLRVDVEPSKFTELELDIKPKAVKSLEESRKTVINPEAEERKVVEKRADELGITYRSDIKTETLIQRIEDREEELVKENDIKSADPLPMDDEPHFALGEIHSGNDDELKPYEEEDLSEVSSEDTDEPEVPKTSIFAKRNAN